MADDAFEEIASETDELLERRLAKVKGLIDVKSSDVNINPFLMLALAPAYNIFSPFEAGEYVQNSKLHHGDATAFGKFIEDKILPPFGVTRPPEKDANPSRFSAIDVEVTVERRRFLMSLKSGPWTMNQAHANEMIANFPAICGRCRKAPSASTRRSSCVAHSSERWTRLGLEALSGAILTPRSDRPVGAPC